MYSSGSFEQDFLEFVLVTLCKLGTWRIQMTISDMTKEMQKLDPKHNINLFRKQYGNTEGALKAIKKPFFYIDSTVIKILPFDQVKAVYEAGKVGTEAWDFYEKSYYASIEKQKDIMKINGQNKCKVCEETYKVIVNKKGLCTNGEAHEATYNDI